MKSSVKTTLLTVALLPMLAACGTYTNDEYSGYGYDRDNVRGHNEYMAKQSSYMNYQQVDTHCNKSWCKGTHKDSEGMIMDGRTNWHGKGHVMTSHEKLSDTGMIAPDGGKLYRAYSERSMDEVYDLASEKCASDRGYRIWRKGIWKGNYVAKFSCINK